MYKCKCDCGSEVIIRSIDLVNGHTTSCGCAHIDAMHELLIKDLTGQRFGKLTVIGKNEIKNGKQYWYCICDCGKDTVACSTVLTTGGKKSCGCLSSVAEFEFATYLEENDYKYIPQYTFDDCKDKRKLPFDFGILDNKNQLVMLVELNGQQHYSPFTYCSESKETKIKNFEDRKRKDQIKEKYCKDHNIPLLIIKYTDFNKKEQIFDNYYKLIA